MVRPDPIIIDNNPSLVVILISADAEWFVVKKHYSGIPIETSPFGEWFQESIDLGIKDIGCSYQNQPGQLQVVFFQGGWGKIAAAASTQYVIDTWKPGLLVNFGTCGGFLGQVERFDIFLVERTIVYDIIEQMGDPITPIAHYSTIIDLSWLAQADPPPLPVRRSLLVSGDRDLIPEEIPGLINLYDAKAGDWESGAIAFVAGKNNQRLVILRGVTDLVGRQGGEAYQNISIFVNNTEVVMETLLQFINWLLVNHIKS